MCDADSEKDADKMQQTASYLHLIFGFLIIACVASCQTKLGGGKIELSGEEFFVEKQGSEVSITTSGVVHCDIAEQDNPDDWVPL